MRPHEIEALCGAARADEHRKVLEEVAALALDELSKWPGSAAEAKALMVFLHRLRSEPPHD